MTPLQKNKIKTHLDIHAINLIDYARTFEIPGKSAQTQQTNNDLPPLETVLDDSVDYFEIPDSPPEVDDVKEGSNVNQDEVEAKNSEDLGGISNEEHKKKGLPWYESKKTRSDVCFKTFLHGQFVRHINVEHQLQIRDYKVIYPQSNLNVNQYLCLACGAIMAHYSSPISGHMSSKHGMTPSEYYEKYVKPNPHKIISFPSKSKDSFKLPAKKLQSANSPETRAKYSPFNVRTQSHKEFTETGKVPWFESITHKCRLCNEEWLLGSFRRHLYERHDKISRVAYKEQFPEENIEPPTWNCNLCCSATKWMKENIGNHLKTVHNMTMEEYGQKYLHYERVEAPKEKPTSNQNCKKSDPNIQPSYVFTDNATSPRITDILAGPQERGLPQERKFRCNVCQQMVMFDSESIRQHLREHHDVGGEEYPDKMLNLAGQKTFTNFDSFEKDPQGGSFIQQPVYQQSSFANPDTFQHFLTPKIDTTAKVPTGPWYNKCKWKCSICTKQFSSGFWKHVNEFHFLKKEEYLRDFGKQGIDIVYYWCQICNKKIPWSGASINGHVKTAHGMSLKEYEVNYGPSVQDKILSASSENLRRNYGKESSKWYNECEYNCQLCSRVLTSGAGLLLHVRDAHSVEKVEYFSRFGRAGITMKKYRCKICFKIIPWSGVSISKHLKQKHGLSLN